MGYWLGTSLATIWPLEVTWPSTWGTDLVPAWPTSFQWFFQLATCYITRQLPAQNVGLLDLHRQVFSLDCVLTASLQEVKPAKELRPHCPPLWLRGCNLASLGWVCSLLASKLWGGEPIPMKSKKRGLNFLLLSMLPLFYLYVFSTINWLTSEGIKTMKEGREVVIIAV